jgi:hypothetical protein
MKREFKLAICAFMLFSLRPIAIYAQWTQVNTGLSNHYVNTFAISLTDAGGTNLCAGTSGGGVFLSTNNGTTWAAVGYAGLDVVALGVSGPNVFAGLNGNETIRRSTNNGISWGPTDYFQMLVYVFAFAVSSNTTGSTSIYAGTYAGDRAADGSGGMYLSTDTGASWKPVSLDHISLKYFSLAVSGPNLVGGTTSGVFVSTNNGANWTGTNLASSTHALALSPNGSGGTTLFAGTLGNGMWLSSDNGKSWSPTAGIGLTSRTIWSIAIAPFAGEISGTSCFAGTDSGVFLSTNNGANWTRVNYGLTNVSIRALAVLGTNLFVGTWGGGVWKRALSDVTDVRWQSTSAPTHFSLEQNYPNPFNPSTNISFSVPSKSLVTLKLYDALGREVTSLLAEELAAGTYSRQWNAAKLPSGVYFYRLQAGEYVETKKMILLK